MPQLSAIFLESGHGTGFLGTKDNGATGVLGDIRFTERDLVVEIMRNVYAILRHKEELKGCDIFGVGIETRMKNSEKVNYVNKTVAEHKYFPNQCLVVSAHLNAGGGHGVEVWLPTKPNAVASKVASLTIEAFTKYGDFEPRKTPILTSNKSRFGGLYIDGYKIPSVLVESFFISSPTDLQTYFQDKNRLAETIVNSIMTYVRS
jgi:N-acetylmuramoyl-L-alanine amidase